MRRRNKLLLLAFLPLLAIAGCATVYQKEGIFSNGYSDFRLSQDTFVVTFRANEHTAPEAVMQYALQRASELVLKKGFSHFEIADQQRGGSPERKDLPSLHYPSLRLTIKCYDQKPMDRETIDARHFLAHQ